jgi:hypothetical protein
MRADICFLLFLPCDISRIWKASVYMTRGARGAVNVLEDSRLAVCVSELWALIS